MEMFEYAFMQRAFIVGVLLALIIPLIGVTVVLRRLSMLGDALSHTSLAGVAAGLLLNVNPVFGASVFCVGAAFGIEGIRRRFPRYAELSISVMLSAGVGLAGVLSGFTKNAANFNSFLFGSIVAISDAELYSVAAVSLLVLLASVLLYKELFSIALDERCVRDAACEELPRHSLGIHRLCRAVHHFRTRHCILRRTEARRNHCADGCCVSDRHTDREIRCGAETGEKGLIFAARGDERSSFFTLSRG